MLELRRVHILATVAAEGTMTAAAQYLHMTTSAVSQQIALLERELDLPLLERTGRLVRLNDAGQTLVEHYRHIAGAIEEAETSLETFRTDVRGTLTISTFPSFCSTILPQALMRLRRDHPGLQTRVRDMEPIQSLSELRSGGIDAAVVDDLHEVPDDGLVRTFLATDELVLCLPQGHPADTEGPLALESLANERWILDTEGSAFERFVSAQCHQAGFEPRVVAHCSNLLAMLGLVRAGYGVAMMSSLNLGRETSDVVVRRVAPSRQRTIHALTRSSSHTAPAVTTLVRALRQATRCHVDPVTQTINTSESNTSEQR